MSPIQFSMEKIKSTHWRVEIAIFRFIFFFAIAICVSANE